MVPEVEGKSPVMQLNSVVLPAPFEPSTARRSPGRTVSVMSVSAASAPNSRVTPRSSSALAVPTALRRSATETAPSCPPVARVADRARMRARQRAHRPSTPSGENSTISRKPSPISSWKRLPSRPTATSTSSAKVRRMT